MSRGLPDILVREKRGAFMSRHYSPLKDHMSPQGSSPAASGLEGRERLDLQRLAAGLPPSPPLLWFGAVQQALVMIGISVFHQTATHQS